MKHHFPGGLIVKTVNKMLKIFFTWAAVIFAASLILCFPVMASTVYWSLFNIEGESALTSDYVTYSSLIDMMNDTNRVSTTSPNSTGFGKNVVGSGSDGTNYWSLFNIEGESALTSDYVTYSSLIDMMNDTNRVSTTSPNSTGFGKNVVGSGAITVSVVPLPAALPLYGAGLAFMGFIGWRRSRKAAATA
jgi:hypothetical protein